MMSETTLNPEESPTPTLRQMDSAPTGKSGGGVQKKARLNIGRGKPRPGPKTLGRQMEEILAMGQNLSPEVREAMLRSYREGAQGLDDPSSPSTQTGTSQSSTGLAKIPIVPHDHRLVQVATVDECHRALLAVGRVLNMLPGPDASRHMAMAMHRGSYTQGELAEAVVLIPNDAALAKECSYSGSVTPAVFAAARVNPKVMRGRLLTYRESLEHPRTLPVKWQGQTWFMIQ